MRKRTTIGITLVGIAALLKCQPLEPIVIMGHSMQPALEPYQVVWATRNFRELQRGDLVVFEHDGERMVKRIVGLPGDKLSQYFLSGEWTVPSYPIWCRISQSSRYPTRTVVVPAGTLFVVGDNLVRSVDSRSYGPIDLSSVEAKLLYQESATGRLPGLRLSRQMSVALNELPNA